MNYCIYALLDYFFINTLFEKGAISMAISIITSILCVVLSNKIVTSYNPLIQLQISKINLPTTFISILISFLIFILFLYISIKIFKNKEINYQRKQLY